ncbi:MAG: SulP family inorganic anion transporter, partial [Gammaproteobacteria bacterium]|nr:SulP family inorganic anion transporter [Gammaproteobacteria bacterium]
FWLQIGDINPYITGVAIVTLLSGIAVKRWVPKIPYLIVSMLVGSLAAWVLNRMYGLEITGITSVGALPATLPPLSAPDFSLDTIKHLSTSALAVTLFALTEAVSIGRSLAMRSGQRIDGNQEFIGQGLSNLAGTFFSGYVATGSFNRSGLNYQAGAKTPLAAVFAGSLLILIVLMVGPLAAYLPNAAMAGILFLVAWGLIDFHEIGHVLKSSRRETGILGVTFFGALFLELELAIFSGVLLSLVLYLMRVAKPRIVTLSPDPRLPKHALSSDSELSQCPQLRLLRIDGSMFFGSVNHVQEVFAEIEGHNPEQKHLGVVCEGINFADIQGGDTLAKEAQKRQARGGSLYLINVKQGLWDSLEKCGALDIIGANHVFQSKRAAITGIYNKLDREICRTCTRRIFHECNKS